MKQKFDLKTAFSLDSLHDQPISLIEHKDSELLLRISKLSFFETSSEAAKQYYMQHKDYTSCDIHFINVDGFSATIGTLNRSNVKGITLFDDEVIKYILEQGCTIEISDMYLGYCCVIICGTFVKSNGHYGDECIIKVNAEEMEYLWA